MASIWTFHLDLSVRSFFKAGMTLGVAPTRTNYKGAEQTCAS